MNQKNGGKAQQAIHPGMEIAELRAEITRIPSSGKKRGIGFVAFVATLGSFLFGYDTGVISGALPFMYMPYGAQGLQLTAVEEGWVGGTLLIGAALGAVLGGWLSDRWGRRHNILLLAVVFFVGSLGTAFAINVWMMYPFRFVLGFAVGAASATVPVYLSETAPKRIRGSIVAVDQVMIVTGQLMAFVFNSIISALHGGPQLTLAKTYSVCGLPLKGGETVKWDLIDGLNKSKGGCLSSSEWYRFVDQTIQVSGGNGMAWRYMLLICSIPAIALWIGMRIMPESPRWYAANYRYYEAIAALKRVRIPEKDGDLAEEIDEMMANNRKAEKQEKGTLGDVFRTPWICKLLFIGCFIAIANQLTGVNTIMYYAPKVLQYAGMSTQAAITAQIANGVMSVIGCSIAVFIIMKFTRRKIYITTEFLIFLILGTVAIMFAIFIEPAMAAKVNPPVWSALVILALMAVFMLVMQTGSSPVMFTVMGEMFPQKVRGVASGAAICTLWIANAIITVSFPKMMESLGGAGTYGVFAVINLLVGIILWKIMPETSGKSLEELEEEFEERYS